MSTNLTRRGLLAGLGLAGVGLTACGGSSSGGGSGALQLAMWGDSTRAGLYEEAAALFTGANSGSSVTVQFADLDPYLERLVTQAAARELPDVLFMRDTHIGRYGSAKALLDLSPHLDTDGGIDTGALGESAIANGQIGDGVFAVPTHFVGQALISNSAVLQAAGIDTAALTSWDDLAAAATELADPAAGRWGIGDTTVNTTHRHLEAWIRQAGEELFTEGGGPGFTADTVGEWFEYWVRLRTAGVVPPADVQIEADGGGNATNFLVTGASGLHLGSTNHLTSFQKLTDNPLQLSSIPQVPDATDDWWFFPPILLSVAANTGDEDLAVALVDFLVNDTDAAALTRLNQGAPSSAAVREALVPTLDPAETAFIEQISREQENPSRPLPIRPEGAEKLNTVLSRVGQEIAYGRQSVSDAVSSLMTQAAQALPEE
jgi:multiple sugar transport system substrate-binding protein